MQRLVRLSLCTGRPTGSNKPLGAPTTCDMESKPTLHTDYSRVSGRLGGGNPILLRLGSQHRITLFRVGGEWMAVKMNGLGQPVDFQVPDWSPPPILTRGALVGRFCTVEPLDPTRHGESLFHANALDPDGRNWTYLPYGPFSTFDSYFEWLEDRSRSSDPVFYAVVESSAHKAVGVVSYLNIDPAGGSIEVGHINYSPLLQRSPAGTEAMYLMMRQAFELGYRRYEWKCDALNEASRTAAQRLGLSFEGVFRQARVVKGRNRDTAWYSAIDKEWPTLKEAFSRWLDPSNFENDGGQRTRLSELTAAALKGLA